MGARVGEVFMVRLEQSVSHAEATVPPGLVLLPKRELVSILHPLPGFLEGGKVTWD